MANSLSIGVMVKISAIICTRNRADYLSKAIQSLCDQRLTGKEYEILVVDNNSSDNTRAIVEEFERRYRNVRYILEREIGLSKARNMGLEHAKGRYVAYLDDDAIANPNWLQEIIHAFENVHPKPACVGGKILPIWEAPKPEWYPSHYLSSLTILDKGDSPRFLNEHEIVFGANMAFQKEALVRLGGFNAAFKLYSDDAFINEQIRNDGQKIYYAPKAYVHHLVPKQRLTKEYICRRKFLGGKGEFLILLSRRNQTQAPLFILKNIFGRPIKIAQLSALWLINKMKGEIVSALECKIQIYRSTGILIQALHSVFRIN